MSTLTSAMGDLTAQITTTLAAEQAAIVTIGNLLIANAGNPAAIEALVQQLKDSATKLTGIIPVVTPAVSPHASHANSLLSAGLSSGWVNIVMVLGRTGAQAVLSLIASGSIPDSSGMIASILNKILVVI